MTDKNRKIMDCGIALLSGSMFVFVVTLTFMFFDEVPSSDGIFYYGFGLIFIVLSIMFTLFTVAATREALSNE